MSKGQYYKHKTKKWFEDKGYFCDYVERLQRIFITKRRKKGIATEQEGRILFRKKDWAGADGIAMNEQEIIFWNSKLGKKNLAEGLKEFLKYPYPSCVKRWVIVWEKKAREPEIYDVEELDGV